MIDIFSLIIIIFAILYMLLIFIGIIIAFNIVDIVKRYPKIYYEILAFYPHKELSFDKNLKYTLRKIPYLFLVFLFGAFSNNRFNEIFNKMYNTEELNKLKNEKLNVLLEKQRKWLRLTTFISNLIMLIIILAIIGFIIFIIYQIKFNGWKLQWN